MIHAQAMTDKLELSPQVVTAAQTATAAIDTIGADYCTVRVALSNIAQATIASADGVTIKLTESEDTYVSNGTTIVANRTAIKFGREVVYHVDTKTRKRYLCLSVIPGTSGATNDHVTACAFSTLSRKGAAPATTTAMVAGTNDAVLLV